ncbi:MAG: methylmalonyl-CoA carboxyltransferase [Negativicoccus succinicivorans]|uniref:methylmalonyl-CoA decarboxylase subunit alpha n=1 Tax=Negativicoccus succinicivorans TaxID=620903 RepID=UPI0026F2C670|nr:carboxyl transferase domain-containing protein [Negativicoccus succinicivorans]MBS6028290.1 methylmalonyl-CoA carboxyltransferase [Negativicoccus succinicivorans]
MSVNQQKVELLHKNLEHVRMGGGQSRIDKQHAKGKMTARERLEILFDEGSFVEIGALVKHRCVNFGQDKKDLPGEGVVTGYGTVDGKLVYAFAQDFTVEGGSLGEMHASKIVRVLQLSLKMGAPCVGLNDSGGARIQEAVDALSGYGRIFFENTIASGVVPQISAIMGPSAGGAVYSPALTDFIYMVDGTSQMFITGPAVVKSVTGEDVTAEKLGGAMTHNSISGVSHFIAKDDEDCLNQIRYLLGFLPSNNMEEAPIVDTGDDPMRMEESLNTLLPDNSNAAYDMYDVIKGIVDNGEYYDVLAHYAKNIITCFARFDGQTVGIIANQPKFMAGCLDINASDKSSRFIRFCDAFNIPLVNLVDVPGFLPGVQQEYGGIIRHGAKMLFAYSEATVPKVTVITRKAYGGSYLAMCSQDLGADQVFAWPTSEIAVMGPAGAANIIFRKDPDKEQKTAEYVEEFATPYKAAERGFVDAVIEPKQTRPYVINALAMLASKREARPAKKHANIPL